MGKYRKSLFIVFVISLFLLIDNVYAESIQNTCSSIAQDCSTKNRFMYSIYGRTDDFYTGSFGSRYSGKADYLVFDFDYDLLGNSTYLLSISASDNDFTNISKSNTYLATSTSCGDATGSKLEITNVSYSHSKVAITFKTVSNATRFMLIFGEDGSSKNVTGVSNFGFSSVDITTVESNDTQNIIDNANQNSQAIIDNNKENTESIIDNQNKNNEELKDTINNNFCSSEFSYNLTKGYSFDWDGQLISYNNSYYTPQYIPLNSTTKITISNSGISSSEAGNIGHIIIYDENKQYVDYWAVKDRVINLGSGGYYFRFSTTNPNVKLSTDACINKIDETNDKLDGINSSITDDSPPDTSGLADAPGWLPPGPVDSIITLPINLLQSLTNNLESACNPINLPLPFVDSNLTIACPATLLKKIDGFWMFWESFGLIAGVWILYKYFINLYKWVECHLSMDEKESLGKWGGV